MTDISQINFNTEELLNNLNIIIQSSLNILVKDFVEKYKIYEETHKGVLNLPYVKKLLTIYNKEVNVISDSESESENNEEPPIFVSIKEMTEDLVEEKINIFEQTMINSFQVFTSTNSMISQKMLSHIETLNNEIKDLKQTIQNMKPPIIDLTHESKELQVQMEIKQIVDEVIIKEEIKEEICEKENIVLHIVEEETESDEKSEEEEEEEVQAEESEEEEEAEESEEEEEEEEEVQAEESQEEIQEEVEDEEHQEVHAEESESEAEVEEVPQTTLNQDIETEAEAEESDSEEELEPEQQEEDDNELFEIEIEDVTYCTNDEENGIIYELTEEGEAGKKVGFLKDGEATFY